jgi:hypothetical protein
VGPRAGPDDLKKRTFLTLQNSNSDSSVVHPVASRYTDHAIPAPGLHAVEKINVS